VQNFFLLQWQQTLDRKHEASSDVLSEVIITAPLRREGTGAVERTNGLYSYGLPLSCQQYLDSFLAEKVKRQESSRMRPANNIERATSFVRLRSSYRRILSICKYLKSNPKHFAVTSEQ
jgi:hypothetical protein